MSSIIRATTTSGLQIAPDNSGSLQLQTNGTTTAVTIDTSQNVGIGTASPAKKIDVVGTMGITDTITSTKGNQVFFSNPTTGTNANYIQLTNTGGALYVGNEDSAGTIISGVAYSKFLWGTGAYPLLFATNGAERMRIDSNGDLYVGATNNGQIVLLPGTGGAYLDIGHVTGTISGRGYSIFRYNSTIIGRIDQNGTTAVSYNTTSDYRLKENIVPMTGALDKVLQLKPVTYTWKSDGSDGQGFIAHELQAVVPDCVTGEKDAVDEEGNIKPQGIDTSFLVATLTAAIQEQQTIINDLKARIETLEAK